MVTKFQLMDLAEKAICEQKTSEFVEIIANSYQTVTRLLGYYENFCSSFPMSCIRLGNVSSYLYHFLASINLIRSDHPTSFATLMNLMYVAVSPRPHHRLMSPFLMKVIILINCMMSGVESLDFSVESTSEHILKNASA